jgi:hypothetical protein
MSDTPKAVLLQGTPLLTADQVQTLLKPDEPYRQRVVITLLARDNELLIFRGQVGTPDIFEDDIVNILRGRAVNTGVPHFAAPDSTINVLFYNGPLLAVEYSAPGRFVEPEVREEEVWIQAAGTVVTYEV